VLRRRTLGHRSRRRSTTPSRSPRHRHRAAALCSLYLNPCSSSRPQANHGEQSISPLPNPRAADRISLGIPFVPRACRRLGIPELAFAPCLTPRIAVQPPCSGSRCACVLHAMRWSVQPECAKPIRVRRRGRAEPVHTRVRAMSCGRAREPPPARAHCTRGHAT